MRILTVPPDQYARHNDELSQMHRLRETVMRIRLSKYWSALSSGEVHSEISVA